MSTMYRSATTQNRLRQAREALYAIAGGSYDSGNARISRISTEQRIAYFKSPAFKLWVAAELAEGRQVYWLKDVDKTQAAGDIFTFFFKWRADNKCFSAAQIKLMDDYLGKRGLDVPKPGFHVPFEVLKHWEQKEAGGEGLKMLEFWSKVYWPTQVGLTEAEKLRQVAAFAESYVPRIYPGVPEENALLAAAGVNVVIVSNGDQELARAVAPFMNIRPDNVVGSHLTYKDGIATGVNHSYEVFDEDWSVRPQPGKPLSFHYWLHTNRARWGWVEADDSRVVIAGRDGDSASADGGMMMLMPYQASIGNFMVDTPGEPDRLAKFLVLASKYGSTRGQFITLVQKASAQGRKP